MKRRPLLPPTYLLICLVSMVALHLLCPVKKLVWPPYTYFGALLIAAGLVVSIWANHLFDKAKTTVQPFEQSSRLIIRGPYRFSRHPMYLGLVVLLIGVVLLLGTVTPVVPVVAFVWVITKKFVVVEERALEQTFGDDYLAYKKRVRCWI